MSRAFTIALLATCLVVRGVQPVLAQELGHAGQGYQYAKTFCSECHGIEHDDLGSPNFAAPPFRTVANTPGMSRRALVVWLQSPHPTMPNLVIPRDDMHDVIEYIMSLKEGAGSPTL